VLRRPPREARAGPHEGRLGSCRGDRFGRVMGVVSGAASFGGACASHRDVLSVPSRGCCGRARRLWRAPTGHPPWRVAGSPFGAAAGAVVSPLRGRSTPHRRRGREGVEGHSERCDTAVSGPGRGTPWDPPLAVAGPARSRSVTVVYPVRRVPRSGKHRLPNEWRRARSRIVPRVRERACCPASTHRSSGRRGKPPSSLGGFPSQIRAHSHAVGARVARAPSRGMPRLAVINDGQAACLTAERGVCRRPSR
jgi:hypothetical protein